MKNNRPILLALVTFACLATGPVSAAETATYKYDARNRLVEMTQGTQTTRYTYDDAGNRTSVASGREGTFNESATHSSGKPLNLRNLADSLGYDGTFAPSLTVTVTDDITGAPGGDAIDTGDWPPDANLTLVIKNGVTVTGGGGNGGRGGRALGIQNGAPGGNGGSAVKLRVNLTIENHGILRGGSGGGGGGGGNRSYDNGYGEWFHFGGGGGGGGWPNGLGGAGGSGAEGYGKEGAKGTSASGGAGGNGGDGTSLVNGGGDGGGVGGENGTKGGIGSGGGGNGGRAGLPVDKGSFVVTQSGNSGTGN